MSDIHDVVENATLVLPDRVQRGWIAVSEGRIEEIGEGRAPERGLDLGGDLLLPGLVELHTDHLETHYMPRPKVRWHPLGAVLAYDAQIAAAGITTVFDSLRVGNDPDGGGLGGELFTLAETLDEARRHEVLRASHRTHLRCEMPTTDVMESLERFAGAHRIGLLSLMDHTPGQRQFRDLDKYFIYARKTGRSQEEIRAGTERRMAKGAALTAEMRPRLVEFARRHRLPLASHDDTTEADVAQAVAEGVSLAEFPTTPEAATACHAQGITIVMGAPNLLRGGSHSGNVSAEALAEAGMLDILSSDYVPGSLLMAAFELPRRVPSISLPQAIACVTANPARATGLTDRGELAIGRRADLVRVRLAGEMPVVRQVWREGRRVS
ncbi:alpha-D-ribose 1-methylphosphonate 5-triphosphate diphosphatase [Roseomonas sp. NAR14]|uniref:Alpha-D-ribose 1-methylphosphonate 5-triphosphate diphosphatase n=1 Tax=Roseomonas acroporae TaxID=2937791 RepID=A0A9X2BY82_9PROT|nr:alpha-D-ribose 1-methylphosphonate 5-triphosphate diphosphatase [Roseomonas acroporae]MCK8785730.1 alpha-D-ribose 1-methylphosphonate 5-triphosphate diphosphatase [Roseomonas acroporae]